MGKIWYGDQEIRTDDAIVRRVLDAAEKGYESGRTELLKISAPEGSGQGDTYLSVGPGIALLAKVGEGGEHAFVM